MRIVYFGIPDLGLICLKTLLERKINIIAVVPPVAEHPAHKVIVNIAKAKK